MSNPNLCNVYWIGHSTSELYKQCVINMLLQQKREQIGNNLAEQQVNYNNKAE